MLLRITNTGPDAPDLGYLVAKNPDKAQRFPFAYGDALVFWPTVTPQKCTVCLAVDITPEALLRQRRASQTEAFDYVNDRPYAAGSLLCSGITRAFRSAMAGRCKEKPWLVDKPLCLEAEVTPLPWPGREQFLRSLFVPLGWDVDHTPLTDETGSAPYCTLRLRGAARLADLLRQLYVLIPVIDPQKHYWVDDAEVDKLLQRGEGWLMTHPEKDMIARRYLRRSKELTRIALQRLNALPGMEEEPAPPPEARLNDVRIAAVADAVHRTGATSVLDIGCGTGALLEALADNKNLLRIGGMDVSARNISRAEERVRALPPIRQERITLFQGSVLYTDARLAGWDAATVVEVIEHLEQDRLPVFAEVLFGMAAPRTVVLTTPDRAYNRHFPQLTRAGLRHADHRFEFTAEEFEAWARKTAKQYGYDVTFGTVGPQDEDGAAPTCMGVFVKCA